MTRPPIKLLETVSEQTVELQRRFTEAFNARDVEALIALCDPTVEIHSTFAELGAVYHGHAGLRRWHRDFEDAWEEVRVEAEAYVDLHRGDAFEELGVSEAALNPIAP